MNTSSPSHAYLSKFVDFIGFKKLTEGQWQSLISALLRCDRLTGLRLISKGISILTVLEEDLRLLHASSSRCPPFSIKQTALSKCGHERMIGVQLDAQSASVLKILQEDVSTLHACSTPSSADGQCGSLPLSLRLAVKVVERTNPTSVHAAVEEHRQAPPCSPSLELIDAAKWQGATYTKDRSNGKESPTVDRGSRTSSNIHGLTTSTAGSFDPPIGRGLARAPPLSDVSGQTSTPQVRRPVAADFFHLEVTPELKSAKYSADDITSLIEEEKAKATIISQTQHKTWPCPLPQGSSASRRSVSLQGTVTEPTSDEATNEIDNRYTKRVKSFVQRNEDYLTFNMPAVANALRHGICDLDFPLASERLPGKEIQGHKIEQLQSQLTPISPHQDGKATRSYPISPDATASTRNLPDLPKADGRSPFMSREGQCVAEYEDMRRRSRAAKQRKLYRKALQARYEKKLMRRRYIDSYHPG
ncbi:MAG: hypothetical protein Q9166_007283 [cf. Caloplaca sp. 2 TL-2023]